MRSDMRYQKLAHQAFSDLRSLAWRLDSAVDRELARAEKEAREPVTIMELDPEWSDVQLLADTIRETIDKFSHLAGD